MTPTSIPNKHTVRKYLEDRYKSQKPPPSLEEIRRQLGWDLLRTVRLI